MPRKQILGKQIRPSFFAFDRLTLQVLAIKSESVNQPFILLIHHILGETVLFIIQYSERSWAFSETVQKISKITHTASRFSFLVRAVSVVECLNEL